ncbi:MAG: hypothetical protein GWN64_07830 [Candidatus Thorarchaeota archaeon]|nr:hypothetical protein [Candidatus Thorarchaeota archaeon]
MSFVLSDKHHEYARKLIKKHQLPQYKKNKKCVQCDGHGAHSVNTENCILPCMRCVNTYPMFKEWLEYCLDFPELRAKYLEEVPNDEPSEDESKNDNEPQDPNVGSESMETGGKAPVHNGLQQGDQPSDELGSGVGSNPQEQGNDTPVQDGEDI